MNKEKRKTALLFDLDGTLLDTLDDLANSVNAMLAHFRFPLRSKAEVRKFVGNGIKKLIERALPYQVDENTMQACLTFFTTYYQEHINDYTKPYSGVMELLQTCHDLGIKMGVVTNKIQGAASDLVNRCFKPYVDVVIGNTLGRKTKPHPESVDLAIVKMGLQKERDLIIFIGDSDVDIMTAQNAQLPVISVEWGFKERVELQALNPDYLVSSPEEILLVLKSLGVY